MQPGNMTNTQTFKIWFSKSIINNETFMFWFNFACIIAAVASIICAIISCKITNKTKNLNKYTMYLNAYKISVQLKDIYRKLINHAAEPGKNYSDEISKLIEGILNMLPAKVVEELTNILNQNVVDYRKFVSNISVSICINTRNLDEQYYNFSSNISNLSNYLKARKELYEGKSK